MGQTFVGGTLALPAFTVIFPIFCGFEVPKKAGLQPEGSKIIYTIEQVVEID